MRVVVVAVLLLLSAAACSSGSGPAEDAAAADRTVPGPSEDSAPPARTGDTSATAVPSEGCGSRYVPAAGEDTQRMRAGGVERQYRRFVPAAYDGDMPAPLVVDLHGLTMTADLEAAVTGMETLADTEGFVVATPQGLGDIPFWNFVSSGVTTDDVSFIEALVGHVGDDLCIDTSRVYATGISNGGLMSSALACRLPNVFAAVAPVAGVTMLDGCEEGPAVPIQVTYGTADNVLPYDGGLGGNLQGFLSSNPLNADEATPAEQAEQVDRIAFPAVDDSLAAWAARNGCAAQPTDERVSDEVIRRSWDACADNTEVVLYLVEGGGHSWPGTPLGAGEADGQIADTAAGGLASVAGHTTRDISATELAWEFFQRHQLQP